MTRHCIHFHCLLQASCARPNQTCVMCMTSSKCVLQQRHLLCYESEPDPWTLTLSP